MPLLVLEEDGRVRRARLDDYIEAAKALLSLIPLGRVTTYASIARLLGISPRLAGRLMALNDEPIIVPCHRVIASDRSLGGYSLGGVGVKRRLLELEGVAFDSTGRVKEEYIVDIEELLEWEGLDS